MPLSLRTSPSRSKGVPLAFAALTSASVVSFDMAGRATRDALFLSAFGPSRLPTMVILGSALALCVGVLAARLMARTHVDELRAQIEDLQRRQAGKVEATPADGLTAE